MTLFVGASESYDTDAWDAYVFKKQNVKLRELCKAWRKFAYEIIDESFGEPEANEGFMELDQRMRELGVRWE